MVDPIFSTVNQIVQAELGITLADVDPTTDIRSQVSIDSMQFVALSVAIEDALAIELPIHIMQASTLNEMLDVIRREVDRRELVP